MFAIIFIWTPPHFWALAVKYKDDYEAAHVPMLPSSPPSPGPLGRSSSTPCCWWPPPWSWPSSAISAGCTSWRPPCLGAGVPALAAGLWRRATPKAAMRLFSYSITYLTLLFVVMAVAVFVQHR